MQNDGILKEFIEISMGYSSEYNGMCILHIHVYIYTYMDMQHKLYHFSYNQETGISIMLVGKTMNHWDVLGYACDMNVIFCVATCLNCWLVG